MQQDYVKTYIRVCVDVVENGCVNGRVYSPCLPRPLIFHDIGELILQTEKLLDVQNYPSAFQRKRRFSTEKTQDEELDELDVNLKKEFMDMLQLTNYKGRLCTFDIRILARQNTTWQGVLEWEDDRQTQPFNSELELIRLLNSKWGKELAF